MYVALVFYLLILAGDFECVFFPIRLSFLKVDSANVGLYFRVQFSVVVWRFQPHRRILKSICNTKKMPIAAPSYNF